jgi:hypothetical protein
VYLNRLVVEGNTHTFWVSGIFRKTERRIAQNVAIGPYPRIFSNPLNQIIAFYKINGDSKYYYSIITPSQMDILGGSYANISRMPHKGRGDKWYDLSGRCFRTAKDNNAPLVVIKNNKKKSFLCDDSSRNGKRLVSSSSIIRQNTGI